jgi:hypothetical protein
MTPYQELTGQMLVDELTTAVPGLRRELEREAAFWSDYGVDSLGPDLAFNRVLAPYVVGLSANGTDEALEELKAILAFLEDLLDTGQEVALSAVQVSFGEGILGAEDREAYDRVRPLLGSQLRASLDSMRSELMRS